MGHGLSRRRRIPARRVRGDATYIVRGRRNSVRYLGFQVMGGMANTANVVADDLEMDDGRAVRARALAERAPRQLDGPWRNASSSLVVRQFFYDWTTRWRPICPSSASKPRRPTDQRPCHCLAAAGGRPSRALGDFVEASIAFWLDVEEGGRGQGVNCFRPPAALTGWGPPPRTSAPGVRGASTTTRPCSSRWPRPRPLYWSVSLGNYWWETIDYANRQSSLNGHQAGARRGRCVPGRASRHRDPGVANWLDTAGNHHGAMIFRWLRARGRAGARGEGRDDGRARPAPAPGPHGSTAVGTGRVLDCPHAPVPAAVPPLRRSQPWTSGTRRHGRRHRRLEGHGPGHRRAPGRRGRGRGRLGPGPRRPATTPWPPSSAREPRRSFALGRFPCRRRRSTPPSPSSDDAWPSLNILVNTLGPGAGRFEDLDDADWEATFDLGLMAAVRGSGGPAAAAPGRVGQDRQLLGPLDQRQSPLLCLHRVQGGARQLLEEPVHVAGAGGDPGQHREPRVDRHRQLQRGPARRSSPRKASTRPIPTT